MNQKKQVFLLFLAGITLLTLIPIMYYEQVNASLFKYQHTATNRKSITEDFTEIDDEIVATVGSIEDRSMNEDEKKRASELHDLAREVFDQMNTLRKENGVAKLKWNLKLEACAHTRAMESSVSFSHTRPDGRQWYTVNKKLMGGENLAMGFTTAKSVMDAWVNSPTHYANLIDVEYTKVGIAVYEVNGKLFIAQAFGY